MLKISAVKCENDETPIINYRQSGGRMNKTHTHTHRRPTRTTQRHPFWPNKSTYRRTYSFTLSLTRSSSIAATHTHRINSHVHHPSPRCHHCHRHHVQLAPIHLKWFGSVAKYNSRWLETICHVDQQLNSRRNNQAINTQAHTETRQKKHSIHNGCEKLVFEPRVYAFHSLGTHAYYTTFLHWLRICFAVILLVFFAILLRCRFFVVFGISQMPIQLTAG